MWIKPLVIILFIALLISLFSGLIFFIKDQGTTRRTVHSLGVRLVIAAALFGFTAYGLYTGELGNTVEWDTSTHSAAPQVAPEQAPVESGAE